MKILTADLTVPGWCSFRIPHSVNVHLTYPAPPPTTVYGLLANAMGLFQDDYSLLPKLRIGVRILDPGSVVETYTRWMKWNPSKNSMIAMVIRQKIIGPSFRIYLSAEPELLERMEQALRRPARLLYLGESDDLVELSGIGIREASSVKSDVIDSVVPVSQVPRERIPAGEVSVIHWPVLFEPSGRSHSVRYGLAYAAPEVRFAEPVPCWRLEGSGDHVLLEGETEDVQSQAVS